MNGYYFCLHRVKSGRKQLSGGWKLNEGLPVLEESDSPTNASHVTLLNTLGVQLKK